MNAYQKIFSGILVASVAVATPVFASSTSSLNVQNKLQTESRILLADLAPNGFGCQVDTDCESNFCAYGTCQDQPGAYTGVDGSNPGSTGSNGSNPGTVGSNGSNPGTTGGGNGGSQPFTNPTKINNLCDFINIILNIIAEIGAIVAVLFIIWSGFLFIVAQGNKTKIEQAKKAFYTTIIGTAILLGASIITKVLVDTVGAISTSISGTAAGGICSSSSSSSSSGVGSTGTTGTPANSTVSNPVQGYTPNSQPSSECAGTSDGTPCQGGLGVCQSGSCQPNDTTG